MQLVRFESLLMRALEVPGGAAGEMRDVMQRACAAVSKGADGQRLVGSSCRLRALLQRPLVVFCYSQLGRDLPVASHHVLPCGQRKCGLLHDEAVLLQPPVALCRQ
jgi:hypothetical protein